MQPPATVRVPSPGKCRGARERRPLAQGRRRKQTAGWGPAALTWSGIWGAIATGIFCFLPVAGLIHGDPAQLIKQLAGTGAAIAFAAIGTLIIGALLAMTIGLRVSDRHERDGLDITIHGERGYHL